MEFQENKYYYYGGDSVIYIIKIIKDFAICINYSPNHNYNFYTFLLTELEEFKYEEIEDCFMNNIKYKDIKGIPSL